MRRLIKTILSLSIIIVINQFALQTVEVVGASESLDQEELTVQDEIRQDFDQLLKELETLDNYKISLRYMNIDANELLAEGEIIGDRRSGNARMSMDIYDYSGEDTQLKSTYNMLLYGEFSLAYINGLEILEDTGFFKQSYFTPSIRKQIKPYENYYIPIESNELATINLNDELFNLLLYFPNLDQIAEISTENIYQLNDSTIIDMERIEIPRGFFQNAGSFSLDYQFNLAINETDHPIFAYEVIPMQQFTVSENSQGLTFKSKFESHITDDLLPNQQNNYQTIPEDYLWESNISTTHVTDKLTKVTISMNPDDVKYTATLTGLYEKFMLNIFSNKTADLESFNYRLELEITPTKEQVPAFNELKTMTTTEFSYLMEQLLTDNNSRYLDDTKLLN